MNATASSPAAGLIPPFGREELHAHMLTAMMVLGRICEFAFVDTVTGDENVFPALFRDPQLPSWPELDLAATDIGLTYDGVRSTGFASTLEDLYELAYLGHYRGDLDSESGASWISRVVYDLARSAFGQEFHEYSPCSDSMAALLVVCETAMARMVLEDEAFPEGDLFMDWHCGSQDGLSFRQLSLLSGMSEPSLRTIASRDPARLPVRSDGRNAFIEPGVAREWLKGKGKYVPLRPVGPRNGSEEMDLSRDGIRTVEQFLNRLTSRIEFLLNNEDSHVALATKAALLAIRPAIAEDRGEATPWVDVDNDDRLLDEALMGQLAGALQLPKEGFVLKCAQLRAKSRIAEIERRMKSAVAGQS